MLGDFNAKSPTWGSLSLDDKGIQVENLLMDLNLSTLNDGQYTYLSRATGTQSALDLTAVSYHINNCSTWKIIGNTMRDHRPIVTRRTFKVKTPAQVKRF
ncbi:hypothetical protein TNCT_502391 [Trichonephila clavata]|uniref:Endonuclease/exonuclease/phosphatase domain-containing protein n=1 Tax=Trichonephila clavata TaxID=2740835 RepID=A0A8X6KC95_TRICU|nr:hypothetical protein TNCT_502391 [Trichonephila clavata]